LIRRAAVNVDATLLRRWPLPQPKHSDGKNGRGRVVVVAGSAATPGAAQLAVDAALRAGAGRVTLATRPELALPLAIALPEARVISLSALRGRELDANCLLIGPGMREDLPLVERLLRACSSVPVILDACAMNVLLDRSPRMEGPVLITPHAGELAHLRLGTREAINNAPEQFARGAAKRFDVGVVLKNATTFIAAADGRTWRHRGDNPGLGISGSGDVLAGIIAGLAARGAPLEQAAVWGVWLHAGAGQALARKIGPLGYLARELAAEVPRLMAQARLSS
jgi:ADP-dependent NAD(P)H-hydrate dehydratase